MRKRIINLLTIVVALVLSSCQHRRAFSTVPCIMSKSQYYSVNKKDRRYISVDTVQYKIAKAQIISIALKNKIKENAKNAKAFFTGIGINCFYGKIIINDKVVNVRYSNKYYEIDTSIKIIGGNISYYQGCFTEDDVEYVVIDISDEVQGDSKFYVKSSDSTLLNVIQFKFKGFNSPLLYHTKTIEWKYNVENIASQYPAPLIDTFVLRKN